MQHASTIQRFWYGRARWITTRRTGLLLIRSGLDLQHPELLTKALGSDKVLSQFAQWFRRFLPDSSPNAQHLLSAFGVCEHRIDYADAAFTCPRALVASAIAFAQSVDALLRDPDPAVVPRMLQCMGAYLTEFDAWRARNDAALWHSLLKSAVARALRLITTRSLPSADAYRDKMTRMALFVGGADEVARRTGAAPELRVVGRLTSSSFWGPGDASVFKLMHEVLMDERFTLAYESVCVRFRAKHQQIHKVPPFLVDLRAVVLFPIRDDDLLVELTRALDFESSPFYVRDCAERLLPLLVRATPEPQVAQRIAASWDGCDRARLVDILGVMREAACSLRYALALVELEQCRRSVHRHPMGLHHTHAALLIGRSTSTTHTEAWLQRALRGHPLLERLAEGDPFALIRFHDHAIMRFALAGDFTPPVPEVLQFDIERMRGLVVPVDGAERLLDMVDTQEVPDDAPQYVKDSVATLGRIVYVCRFQHGERLAEMVRRVARALVAAKDA